MNTNNSVFLQGTVASEPVYDHDSYDEKFYNFNLSVSRLSEEKDLIPITISEHLLPRIKLGDKLALRGQFRSHNKLEDNRSKLILSVFCKEICELDSKENSNVINLDGYICKPPIFRNTPLAREICDLLLAVNRNYNKSDYIPCIAWGRNAQFVSKLPTGSRLKLTGRIQSREYKKQIEGQEPISKLAYEVSISNVALLEVENEKIVGN